MLCYGIPVDIRWLARGQGDPGARNPPRPKAEGDFGHQGLPARGPTTEYLPVSHSKALDFDFVQPQTVAPRTDQLL